MPFHCTTLCRLWGFISQIIFSHTIAFKIPLFFFLKKVGPCWSRVPQKGSLWCRIKTFRYRGETPYVNQWIWHILNKQQYWSNNEDIFSYWFTWLFFFINKGWFPSSLQRLKCVISACTCTDVEHTRQCLDGLVAAPPLQVWTGNNCGRHSTYSVHHTVRRKSGCTHTRRSVQFP